MTHSPGSQLFGFLTLLQTVLFAPTRTSSSSLRRPVLIASSSRAISTTSPRLAGGGGGGKVNKNVNKTDPRITLIRYHLQHPKTPRPLRFSRMRALRHWTIHRAWMLFRRKKAAAESLELQRLYRSMHDACEELRNLDPPHAKDAGRLFRIAMGKQGIFRPGGIPIEYARAQTETPATEVWDHGWKR